MPVPASRRSPPAQRRRPRPARRPGACLRAVRPCWARIVPVAGALAVLFAAAACSSSPPASRAAAPVTSAASAVRASHAVPALASVAPQDPPRVTVSRIRTADGSAVTVAVFRGPVQYVLHNGSQDPGRAYAALVRAGPAVTGAERRRLLAAFNGGFLMRSRAGGYEQEGHVFSRLRHGLASLVIDPSGQAADRGVGRDRARAGGGRLQRPAEPVAPGE